MNEKTIIPVHIRLYEEIISGRFNPSHTRYNNPDVLKGLIEEVNTCKVAVLSANDNPQDFIEHTDFTQHGYKSHADYDIDIRPQNNGKVEIYIKPVKVYELLEMIDIPYFNSFKCNTYLELMGDEFERIAIRAEKMLDNSDDEKATRIYASKHVQKAKKLFHDSKRLLRDIQKSNNPEDIYIIFALNLFIIRTIMFYQKMFKPFLKHEPDIEEKLFTEVLKEVSLKKLCSLFPRENSSYCDFVKKSYIEKSGHTENEIQESHANEEKDQLGKKSFPTIQGEWPYSPLKWNGQINVFIDVLTQLTEETRIAGVPVLETTEENLLNFILTNFRDRDGKEFSYYTISTLLKKSRTDKRLHPQSPKRIDVSRKSRRK